ncbi:MAG TPA: hypothetical protein VKB22_06425, partial [Gemmatimonadales bacterium]|nr:hypothetical protein [Gemmatimonadales bacterium]
MRRFVLLTLALMQPDPAWADGLLRILTHPLVSPVLLSVGILGLILEIKTGAFGLGGLLGLISLGLFFASSFLLGLAGWQEVLLLGFGLIALAVEAFIIPGFGIAGIVGILAVTSSVLLALVGSHPTSGDV